MKEKKILVVDDDKNLSQLVAAFLRTRNFQVDIASNGEEALTKSRHHPDLLLLDRSLPDIDGLEICRRIREDKRFRNIPIIILSARDKSADKIEGLYIGADDYVTKPFDREELLARIEALLRRNEFSVRAQKDRAVLIGELKKIINEELITTFFQPIYSFEPFQILGYEVLSRPPTDSPLSNPEFLFKSALAYGMYFELEMMCWRQAIMQWKNAGSPSKLFLNCSPYLIESDEFNDMFLLKEAGVAPRKFVLELTERMAIEDYALFLDKVDELKKLEVSITVDDVGCGFASLDTVAEVKPDFVKIDMPLIRDIHIDGVRQSIVEAVVDFCKKCHIVAIAEGIERKEELAKVIELGVNAGQGYLLARPETHLNFRNNLKV